MDFGLTTLLCWGFVVIQRLLTETSWGLALGLKGGLAVQPPLSNLQTAKGESLRRCSLSCPGIGMELGKLSLLRHIPRKQ